MNRNPLLAIAIAALLAGCAAPSAPLATQPVAGAPAATTRAPVNETVAAVGAIAGTITDPELSPIAGANVELTSIELAVATDAEGRFRFDAIPVGVVDVFVARTGYASAGKKVEVKPDEVAAADFILAPLAIIEPFHLTLSHASYHGLAYGSQYDTYTRLSGQEPCQACDWSFGWHLSPLNLLVEVTGTHSFSNPQGAAKAYVWVEDNDTKTTESMAFGNFAMPTAIKIAEGPIKGNSQFKVILRCDSTWICYQEKRDTFITGFFHQPMPEGFTALPK